MIGKHCQSSTCADESEWRRRACGAAAAPKIMTSIMGHLAAAGLFANLARLLEVAAPEPAIASQRQGPSTIEALASHLVSQFHAAEPQRRRAGRPRQVAHLLSLPELWSRWALDPGLGIPLARLLVLAAGQADVI